MPGARLEGTVAEFQGCLSRDARIGLWLDTRDQTPEDTVDGILAGAWTEGGVE
jgi:hypothetical protein